MIDQTILDKYPDQSFYLSHFSNSVEKHLAVFIREGVEISTDAVENADGELLTIIILEDQKSGMKLKLFGSCQLGGEFTGTTNVY